MLFDLGRLPPELLPLIAAEVREYHVPSFVAFASASKTLRAACTPILFSTIIVDVPIDKIEPTISRCMAALSENDLLRHVRRLSLRLSPQSQNWEQPMRPLTNLSRLPGTLEIDPEAIAQAKAAARSTFPESHSYHRDEEAERRVASLPKLRVDEWLPASRFVKDLHNLKDLIFDARGDSVPHCILKSLHEHLPHCRLSIERFTFVGEESTKGPHLDPSDIALVQSPNLHHITINHATPSTRDHFKDNHGLETALSMVGGISPNIKSIRTTNHHPPLDRSATHRWQGLRDLSVLPRKSPLVNLALFDRDSHLRQWSDVVDTSMLRSLSLATKNATSEAELHWMAANARLPNLKHLRLFYWADMTLETTYTRDVSPTDGMAMFLGTLPPLEHLEMRGVIPPNIVGTLLPHHGPALRTLTIRVLYLAHLFTSEVFHLITRHCGILHALDMPLRRTASGLNEAAALDSLGRIKTLHTLRLELNSGYLNREHEKIARDRLCRRPAFQCPTWALDPLPLRTDQPLWSAWDHQRCSASVVTRPPIYNGDIRNAFIRAALDERFVRAVWDRLHRQGCRLRLLDLPAPSVTMRPSGSGPDILRIGIILGLMETHFVLQRSIADDETIFAVDLAAEKIGAKPSPDPETISKAMVHFRRLWPPKSADGSWRDDWSSLPFPQLPTLAS